MHTLGRILLGRKRLQAQAKSIRTLADAAHGAYPFRQNYSTPAIFDTLYNNRIDMSFCVHNL